MSVNKLLTLINLNCDRRNEENSSLDKSDKSIEISKSYIMVNENLIIIPNMFNPVVTESFLFLYDFYFSQLLFCLFHIRFSFRNCEIIKLSAL